MILWNDLCDSFSQGQNELVLNGQSMDSEILKYVDNFCSGYSINSLSGLTGEEDHSDEISQNLSRSWEDLVSSPDDYGKDIALDIAISELHSALADLNDYRVMEIVWFLSLSDLVNPPLGNQVTDSDTLYSGMVSTSVSTALFCNQIGGCYRNHPLKLRICMITPGRRCFRPDDIYEAVEQTHAGMEVIAFRSLLGQIQSHLYNYRRSNT